MTLDLSGSPVFLQPGTYWLVYFPIMNCGGGFHYWFTSPTNNGASGQRINPSGALGLGTTWGSGSSWHDISFRLEGPDPATLEPKVPTLNQWGLLSFASLLAAASLFYLRRRVSS